MSAKDVGTITGLSLACLLCAALLGQMMEWDSSTPLRVAFGAMLGGAVWLALWVVVSIYRGSRDASR